MKVFTSIVGSLMALGSLRFALDAGSHTNAAVSMAGLAIGTGLCLVANAIASRGAGESGEKREPKAAEKRGQHVEW